VEKQLWPKRRMRETYNRDMRFDMDIQKKAMICKVCKN
jgi:hypothetical protein